MKLITAAWMLMLLMAPGIRAQPTAEEASAATAVNVRPDERRAAQPFTVSLFDRPLALRLGYDLSIERRKNFDLNQARDRDRRARDQELKADARWQLTPQLTVFAEAVAISEVRHQKATGTTTRDEGFQRGQLWLQVDRLAGTPLSLQVGRIPLVDRRTFWWDEDLDAARLMARGSNWYAEAGFGREIARAATYEPGIDRAHRGVRRWFGQAGWSWQPRHTLEAFALRASDRSGTPVAGSLWSDDDADPSDARLAWLGLRASGNGRVGAGQRYAYWADLARVSGRESLTSFTIAGGQQRAGATRQRPVRGHAVDLGAQWTFGWPLRPTVTLGWARGSGAVPDAAVDRNFRQTGLQENKARLGGVKRLQRYGELLDPELSNLRVATTGLGLRLLDNTSAELVWHRYRQGVASPVLAGSRLSQAPAGLDPRLGQEFDFFLAWRESRHLEFTVLIARFLPGPAFAANRRDAATGIELGIALNY